MTNLDFLHIPGQTLTAKVYSDTDAFVADATSVDEVSGNTYRAAFPTLFAGVYLLRWYNEIQSFVGSDYFTVTGAGTFAATSRTGPISAIRHIHLANRAFLRLLSIRSESVTITRGNTTTATRAVRARTSYAEPNADGSETIIRRDDWLFHVGEYMVGSATSRPAQGDKIRDRYGDLFTVMPDHESEDTEPLHPELLQLRVRTRKGPD